MLRGSREAGRRPPSISNQDRNAASVDDLQGSSVPADSPMGTILPEGQRGQTVSRERACVAPKGMRKERRRQLNSSFAPPFVKTVLGWRHSGMGVAEATEFHKFARVDQHESRGH